MDNMLEHPGTELQVLIKEKGLTQKAFASILGKKVSEVNELLKGKRNITIQRDYLLHQTLGTPIKYWILKQIDYEYSLIDIEETNNESFGTEGEESTSQETSQYISEEHKIPTNISPANLQQKKQDNMQDFSPSLHPHSEGQNKSQETPIQEPRHKDDEDFRKRANIFRSF